MTEPTNWARWSNPLTVAIVAAALAGFSNAIIAFENNRAQLELETIKAESGRILEVLKVGEPDRVRENLRFLLQLGLVESEDLRNRIEAWEANPGRAPVYLSPAAVAAFQREAGMPADGLAGPATRQRMEEADRARARPGADRTGY